MLAVSGTGHKTNMFGTDLLQQLDPNDSLLQLVHAISWFEFEQRLERITPREREDLLNRFA